MDLKTNIEKRLGTTIAGADDKALYYALLGLTKELCSEKKPNEGDRKVYYISAEFLIGKLLSNNLINLGVYDEVRELLAANGHRIPSTVIFRYPAYARTHHPCRLFWWQFWPFRWLFVQRNTGGTQPKF